MGRGGKLPNSRMKLRRRPLPKTKLIYEPIHPSESSYALPNLDEISLLNGICKYFHPQWTITWDEYLSLLDNLDQLYGTFMEVPMWTKEKAWLEIDTSKSAGSPYDSMYGPTKGHAMKYETPDSLIHDFWHFTHVFNATLKDELRVRGKDARLFIPANLCLVFVGNLLFGAQNENLANYHKMHPFKVGMTVPGMDTLMLWKSFEHLLNLVQYDGGQWDTHIPAVFIMLVRDLRKRHLPEFYHEWVDRYYNMIYFALVNVGGDLVQIIGQLSGQTNTTTDNCFFNELTLLLHALRKGLTVREYSHFQHCIVGDDGLYSDPDGIFDPLEVGKTWNSVGMYMETPGYQSFEDLTFIGTHPKYVFRNGRRYLLYGFREEKVIASLNYVEKGFSDDQKLSKLCALTLQLLTNDDFEYYYYKVLERVKQLDLSVESRTLLASLNRKTFLVRYLSLD